MNDGAGPDGRVAGTPDLAEALAADRAAKAAFDALSFTRRKEHARAVAEAKKPETRERRVARTMTELRGD